MYVLQVGTNGLISFDRPFNLWHPRLFPSNDPLVSSANILAPYWSDNDIRKTGEISYASFQHSNSAEGDSLLTLVTNYIRFVASAYPDILDASQFIGNFMVVAEWDQVHPFPHGSLNLTNILDDNPSISDFVEMVCIVTYNF